MYIMKLADVVVPWLLVITCLSLAATVVYWTSGRLDSFIRVLEFHQ